MAEANFCELSPIKFAIKNLWQLKDSYTMNLILFEDDEIECEDNDLRVIHLNQNDYRCKHIETVLKSKSGDTVRVGIINGKQGLAKIIWNKNNTNNNSNNTNIESKSYLRLEIIESSMKLLIDQISESITLILAMPRPKVLNRLYPILSSLGIKEIVLINAKRVEKSYFNSKYLEKNRYTKGLIAGMVQCKDTKIPQLIIEKNLNNFICNKLNKMYPLKQSIRIVAHPGDNLLRINELKCFKLNKNNKIIKKCESKNDDKHNLEMSLDEQINKNEMKENEIIDMNNNENKQFILLIGPEGGWIDDEIEIFKKNDFNLCSIGNRILRTDVACISLLSILRANIEQYLMQKK
eukprot:353414_1